MEAMNSTTVHSWCGCMHVVPYGRGLHGRRRPCQQHNLSPPDPLLLLLPLPLLPPPLSPSPTSFHYPCHTLPRHCRPAP